MSPPSTSAQGIGVIFATPTLDHRVSIEYLRSSKETDWLLDTKGISYGYKQVAGDTFVAKARNRLVTEFLLEFPSASHLFFLDDDIGWPAAKVWEFLNRPEDIVAGAYPKKCDKPEFPVELELADGRFIERDGLYRAILAPTGFMCIRRGVLERMAAASTCYKEAHIDGEMRDRWAMFEAGVYAQAGEWWGEDYCFCQKWRDMGGEIWVDPDIEFSHRGHKKWTGNFGHHLGRYLEQHPEQRGKLLDSVA